MDIERLKELNWLDFIKVKETVDREAIKEADLTPEVLGEFGTRIEQKESFFIEPKVESADGVKAVS